ncbi:zinc-binding dehydrogenase [Mangrovivirga cuniculi]|uniref:zinc-binding dehydrogenase n=1 Tax=Mangrovivirga cuniculi TaxID=2715131 RepID=UPI001FEA2C6B|nr:zinc-binding dehydrogenase [Mangrovivirga cuniculi]
MHVLLKKWNLHYSWRIDEQIIRNFIIRFYDISFTGKKLKILTLKPNKGLDQISELAEKGQIKPVIDGPHRFEQIPELIQYLGDGKHLGKIVVEID